ncbi:uncharacterized protein [Chanodichthys erythropterus]|uniref:uncharacterized protein n=1 Tax=Chanodichthys erythropterus TaxID=933992 RepID=UPI00351F0782
MNILDDMGMFRRCLTPFCILILLCMVSTHNSAPLGYRGALSFSNSLRLTRTVRSRVQQLMSQYKQQVFGGELFEYRDLKLSTLPAVTVSYQTWLHMQDAERLRLASHFLQTFWTHLERQRQQFERERDATKERREQRRDKQGRPQPTLSQSLVGLQIDLRDLMKNKSRALRLIPVCKQVVKSLTVVTRHIGSLITVILQLKDAVRFMAALLHYVSPSYQLSMIFKCKVSHFSFLGRFRRKETREKYNNRENPDISLV